LSSRVRTKRGGTRQALSMGDNALEFVNREWSVGIHQAKLVTVNAHWVTFEVQVSAQYAKERSEPMEKVLLSWDDERRRLKVLIRNWPNV